jgi:DNA ligase-associated metallophosphoesterase
MMPFSPKPLMNLPPRPHGLSRAHHISLGGITFLPDLSGAVYAPELQCLLVADLHLEQGAALARRGIAVPPFDTSATLTSLEHLVSETAPRRLYLLGDSFHDDTGHAELAPDVVLRIRRITEKVETFWISGNHDPQPKHGLGGESMAEVVLAPSTGLTLRHEPRRRLGKGLEIAGHLHPGAGIAQRGHLVRAKCIIADERRMILPAFGAYTGALSVTSRAFHGLFETERANITMLAREKIYRFPFSRVA